MMNIKQALDRLMGGGAEDVAIATAVEAEIERLQNQITEIPTLCRRYEAEIEGLQRAIIEEYIPINSYEAMLDRNKKIYRNVIDTKDAEIERLTTDYELLSDDYTQLTEDNRLLHRRLGMQAAATDSASEHVEQLRELLREASDNVRASIAEEGITESRREYRKGLYHRLQAAVTGREN